MAECTRNVTLVPCSGAAAMQYWEIQYNVRMYRREEGLVFAKQAAGA